MFEKAGVSPVAHFRVVVVDNRDFGSDTRTLYEYEYRNWIGIVHMYGVGVHKVYVRVVQTEISPFHPNPIQYQYPNIAGYDAIACTSHVIPRFQTTNRGSLRSKQ
jgi:hypothetical protein